MKSSKSWSVPIFLSYSPPVCECEITSIKEERDKLKKISETV